MANVNLPWVLCALGLALGVLMGAALKRLPVKWPPVLAAIAL